MKPFYKSLATFLFILAISNIAFAVNGTVKTITYHSSTQNTSCKMNIYFPPGYTDSTDSSNFYPVFYMIHGGGENYTHWIESGYADKTLDNAINSGKATPMLLVMPDAKNLDPAVFCNELLNDIIPYIEKNYRVRTDKDSRGVGGLSWGGLQAMEAGIFHYEMFGYVSILSSGWFATDNAAYDRAKIFLTANASEMEKSYRYFYFGEGTKEDIAYANGQATLKVLRENKLTIHYWEFPSGHWWGVWREDFKAMVPFLFRDEKTCYISLDFQGGNIVNSTVMLKSGELAKEPATPVRTGYDFSGWYREPSCISKFNFASDTVSSNTTIYANWKIKSFTVSFNSNGGNQIADIKADYDTKITEPAIPQRTGYVFEGWYTNQNYNKKWNFSTDKVSGNIKLVAKWKENTSSSKDYNSEGISLFPNPAGNTLQLKNRGTISQISIYDAKGISIYNPVLKDNCIDISGLPDGSYYIVLNQDDKLSSLKFLKRN